MSRFEHGYDSNHIYLKEQTYWFGRGEVRGLQKHIALKEQI